MTKRMRRNACGLVGIALIAAFTLVNVGVFRHSFSSPVMVSMTTPRAGLLTQPGTEVRLRGISVGTVRSVKLRGTNAVLSIALDSARAGQIPSDVVAGVEPATLLGGSFVRLTSKPGRVTQPVKTGAVLAVARTVPDLDTVFEQVVGVLNTVRVDELNVTLSSLSRTLDGRGQRLGQFITDLNAYLTAMNRHSGALSADLRLSGPVLQTYAAVAPDLMKILRNATVTGNTIVARKADVAHLLKSFDSLGDHGMAFINQIDGPLLGALFNLAPVTKLLADYSPEYACMLKAWSSMARDNNALGNLKPGAQVVMTFLPGQQGYQYNRDLPRFVDNRGPRCYSLPGQFLTKSPPRRDFNDGSHVYDGSSGPTVGNPPVQFFPEVLPK